MKILITGGAGFIGANLVRMLHGMSCQILVLDDLSIGDLSYIESEFIEGSILDQSVVYQAVEWADRVVHLAGQSGIILSLDNPHLDCVINITGTLNVLDACRKANIKRFVFVSSSAADEALSPYGASKAAAENYCSAYRYSYGLDTVVLRLKNVYGPYSRHKNSVVARFFKDIENDRQITIEGDGQQTRDFIHVSDVCRAIVVALESDRGGIFQIRTGIHTSISGLAATITSFVHHNVEVKYIPPRLIDTKKARLDIGKRLGNWRPKIKLPKGLIDTWKWFNDNSDHAHQE